MGSWDTCMSKEVETVNDIWGKWALMNLVQNRFKWAHKRFGKIRVGDFGLLRHS